MELLIPKRLASLVIILMMTLISSLLLFIIRAGDKFHVIETVHMPLLERSATNLRLSEQIQVKLNLALTASQALDIEEIMLIQQALSQNLTEFEELAISSGLSRTLFTNLNRNELNKIEEEIINKYLGGDIPAALKIFQSDRYFNHISKHTDAMQTSSERLSQIRSGYAESQSNFFKIALVASILLTSTILTLVWKLLSELRHNVEKQKISEIMLEEERLKSIHTSKLAALGEMAGGVAHEINNPLAIIKGYTEILLQEGRKDQINKESFEKLISNILQTTERISKIVLGLRKLTRAAGSDPKESVAFKTILDETLSLCRERFQSHGIKIEVAYEANDMILCNSIEISQVLINLLNNAYDAIINDPEPWVKISCHHSHKQQQLIVSVTDSGKGIPTELQKNIMNPFFTTKEIGKGTGLGLSISKGILTNHRGELRLDPYSSNTKFTLSLPLLKEQVASEKFRKNNKQALKAS